MSKSLTACILNKSRLLRACCGYDGLPNAPILYRNLLLLTLLSVNMPTSKGIGSCFSGCLSIPLIILFILYRTEQTFAHKLMVDILQDGLYLNFLLLWSIFKFFTVVFETVFLVNLNFLLVGLICRYITQTL